MVEMLHEDWPTIMQCPVASKVLCSITDTSVESQFQALWSDTSIVEEARNKIQKGRKY